MPKEILSAESIEQIHNTAMRVLGTVGVSIPQEEALEVFRQHGVRVDNGRVYLTEDQVMDAIKNAPKQFTINARDPEKSVVVGGGDPVLAPGYGAPFIIDAKEGKRSPTLDDYHNLAKIAHQLQNIDVSGHLIVEPEMPNAHLHMLHAHLTHSDKPIIGSTAGAEGAQAAIDMAGLAFGEKIDKPVMISLVNSLSPLGFATDMLDVLLVYAKAGQPIVIAALGMAGTTAPITLAGVLASQTAELMTGLTLAQYVNPGTPMVFGSTSSNVDMRMGSLSIGSPELSMLICAHGQLARFYGLPSRSGGSLTDASYPDAQAGFESMMALMTTFDSDISFVLHSAGILASYLAFSYEKFILDEEMISMVRRLKQGFPVDESTLAFEVIQAVGPGGNFLQQSHTLKRCRKEFWKPNLCDRGGVAAWVASGGKTAVDRATARWQSLLESHVDPPMDAGARKALDDYLEANA